MYRYVPAAAAEPQAWVDEDNTDRLPFGFQRPTKRTSSSGRPRSRQAEARAHHARRMDA